MVYIAVSQLLRDRFTIIERPRAELRVQFLNEMAPMAALHITSHPMAVASIPPTFGRESGSSLPP